MQNNNMNSADMDQRHDSDSVGVAASSAKDAAGELAIRRGPESVTTSRPIAYDYEIGLGKRLFDIVGALLIGVALAPVMVIIAIAIRISGTPIIFSHNRIGLNRKSFRCFKFRSMVPDADERLQTLLRSDPKALREWRTNHKLRDDPRVTPLGRFLRRSSMDELPQLWNVLKGDMSLVGPRPIVPDELERYGNKVRTYCSVRPGMTGLWQVMGRNNVTYSRRVSMDVLYIRKQSFLVDCWVMWQTIFVVIGRIGAY